VKKRNPFLFFIKEDHLSCWTRSMMAVTALWGLSSVVFAVFGFWIQTLFLSNLILKYGSISGRI